MTLSNTHPDNKVHGASMGPTWVLSAPDGPHVDPMNLTIRAGLSSYPGYFWGPVVFQLGSWKYPGRQGWILTSVDFDVDERKPEGHHGVITGENKSHRTAGTLGTRFRDPTPGGDVRTCRCRTWHGQTMVCVYVNWKCRRFDGIFVIKENCSFRHLPVQSMTKIWSNDISVLVHFRYNQ